MCDCNCGSPAATSTLNILTPGKFGRCRFCIYSSFGLSAIGWTSYALFMRAGNTGALGALVLGVAFSASCLFVVHIGMLAKRRIERSAPPFDSRSSQTTS